MLVETGELDERKSEQAQQKDEHEDAEHRRSQRQRVAHDRGSRHRAAHDELDWLATLQPKRLQVQLVRGPSERHRRPAADRAQRVPFRLVSKDLPDVVDLQRRRTVGLRVAEGLLAPAQIAQPLAPRGRILVENDAFVRGHEDQGERIRKRQLLKQPFDAIAELSPFTLAADLDRERGIEHHARAREAAPANRVGLTGGGAIAQLQIRLVLQ